MKFKTAWYGIGSALAFLVAFPARFGLDVLTGPDASWPATALYMIETGILAMIGFAIARRFTTSSYRTPPLAAACAIGSLAIFHLVVESVVGAPLWWAVVMVKDLAMPMSLAIVAAGSFIELADWRSRQAHSESTVHQ
jgi:hypothetical protein